MLISYDLDQTKSKNVALRGGPWVEPESKSTQPRMAQVTEVNWPAFGNIKNYMMVAPIYLFILSSHFQETHFFLNSSLSTPCIAQYCLITRPSNIAQPGVCQTSDNKQFDGMRFNSSSKITHICLTLSGKH